MELRGLVTAARSWATLGSLAVLFLVLAVLQYNWTGEISRAEEERLRQNTQAALDRLSQDFDREIQASVRVLQATSAEIGDGPPEPAYEQRFERWRNSARDRTVFRRIAVAIANPEATVDLRMLDHQSGRYVPSEWPQEWAGLRRRMTQRLEGGPPPGGDAASNAVEVPRFDARGGGREKEWLVVELDTKAIAAGLLPRLIDRHLGAGSEPEIRVLDGSGAPVFPMDEKTAPGDEPDVVASVFSGRGPSRGPSGPDDRKAMPPTRAKAEPAPRAHQGRWSVEWRHKTGLEALVTRSRWRNLAISTLILALMLASMGALVHHSRQAEQLARMQMNFVAGVSHELRTPLAVIRTAAYNLKGRVAANPSQVEKYGALIQEESERLAGLVERVLQFSSAQSGKVIRTKEPVAVEDVVEEGLRTSRAGREGNRWQVEKRIEPGLPLVLGDEVALRHLVQNLVDNAVKYGTEGSDWIGVTASAVSNDSGPAVEIRVADRGPGIPKDEQAHLFDAFFRGTRAVQDQISGTGLGLNLVKKIVDAHGGDIRVYSEPMKGAEFVVRLPAAPAEYQDEFAHSLG